MPLNQYSFVVQLQQILSSHYIRLNEILFSADKKYSIRDSSVIEVETDGAKGNSDKM